MDTDGRQARGRRGLDGLQSSVVMIVGVHHIARSVPDLDARSVPDLDAAAAFSTEHLGFTEVFSGGWNGDRPDNDRVIVLDAPVSPADHGLGTIVELYEVGGAHGLEQTGATS